MNMNTSYKLLSKFIKNEHFKLRNYSCLTNFHSNQYIHILDNRPIKTIPSEISRPYKIYPFENKEKSNGIIANKYSEAQNSIQRQVEDWSEIFARWYKNYQEFVGITSLTMSQEKVKTVTTNLIDIQRQRRIIQSEIENLQREVVNYHLKMSKTEMFSDEHVTLFEKARNSDKLLKDKQDLFTRVENDERDTFTQLTTAISECHEKEKSQAENSKYWSIVFSVISAAIASVVTSVNNWIRIKEIKEHAKNLNNEVLVRQNELYDLVNKAFESKSTEDQQIQKELKDIAVTSSEQFSKLGDDLKQFLQEDFSASIRNELLYTDLMNIGVTESQVVYPEYSMSKIATFMAVGAVAGTILMSVVFGSSGS